MVDENRYLAAKTVSDIWICYPWEATSVAPLCSFVALADSRRDIDEHDLLAATQGLS